MEPIEIWSGEHEFLRNDFPCDVEIVTDDGETAHSYGSAESAFQAGKTEDEDEKSELASMSAHEAKRFGRSLTLPSDWGTKRIDVMEKVLRAKFTQNNDLGQLLVDTGDAELRMLNRRDDFWGIVQQPDGSVTGENRLGQLLMKIRDELSMRRPFQPKPRVQVLDTPKPIIDPISVGGALGASPIPAPNPLQRAIALAGVGDLKDKLEKCGVNSDLATAMAELYEAGKKAAKEFGDGNQSTLVGVVVTKIERSPGDYAKIVGDVGKAVENLAAAVSRLHG